MKLQKKSLFLLSLVLPIALTPSIFSLTSCTKSWANTTPLLVGSAFLGDKYEYTSDYDIDVWLRWMELWYKGCAIDHKRANKTIIKEKMKMGKFDLVTIRKGEIKTIDVFIQNFNSIAHNMKALSVTTYNFLSSDDKEFVKEFRMRTMDELNMSNATITNLKNAGMMYTLSDRFEKFSYTNVIYFVNAIKFFTEKYNVIITEGTPQTIIDKMLLEIIQLHNSRIEDVEKGVEELLKLNQKELKHLIDVYTTTGVEVVEAEEESEEESEEEAEEESTEEVEIVDNKVTYLDDDINNIITIITEIEENKKMTKQAILDKLAEIKDILLNETM